MNQTLRITVWNEFRLEQISEKSRGIYPQCIHHAIGKGLGADLNISYRRSTG